MCYKVTGLYPPRLEDTNHEVLFTRAKKTQLYAKGASDWQQGQGKSDFPGVEGRRRCTTRLPTLQLVTTTHLPH